MYRRLSLGTSFSVRKVARSLSTHETDVDALKKLIEKSHREAKRVLTDLRQPSKWYPLARKFQRTIIAHVGPTNSGKTHGAMDALIKAKTGIYCAPLRLLAWEGYERLRSKHVECSLLTGQEAEKTAADTHVSCTMEMANLSKIYEVGVIDEYQLMGDAARGWAFTRVVLGLAAKTVYVCGHPSALALLAALCNETGDVLQVVTFERLSPLDVEETGIESLDNVEKGDCLIAFSRRDIHLIKRIVEAGGQHSCCMVYGALPPETRKKQAQWFNDRNTEYNVLVASDAIGLGLNLDIRRIIFTTIEKFDGTQQRFLSIPEVKQISGRAGRYGSTFSSGYVSSVRSNDIQFLKYALTSRNPNIDKAGVLPRFEQFALLAEQIGTSCLADVIDAFQDQFVVSGHYFLSDLTEMRHTTSLFRHLPLTLREQYLFAMSPVDSKSLEQASEFLRICTAYAFHHRVPLACGALVRRLPTLQKPKTDEELRLLENIHAVLDLYSWLANRLPDCFYEGSMARKMRQVCARAVEQGLDAITFKRRRPWKPKAQNFQNLAQLDEYMRKLETASASFPHSQQSSEIKDL